MTGQGPKDKKKRRVKIEDLNQNDIDIMIDIIDGKYDTLPKWKRFQIIYNNNKNNSINKLFNTLNVTRQGYYRWLKNGMKSQYNKNKDISQIVWYIFHEKNGSYGCRRTRVKVHYHTVLRYINLMGIKTKIRQKGFLEIKNTTFFSNDLIKRNF